MNFLLLLYETPMLSVVPTFWDTVRLFSSIKDDKMWAVKKSKRFSIYFSFSYSHSVLHIRSAKKLE